MVGRRLSVCACSSGVFGFPQFDLWVFLVLHLPLPLCPYGFLALRVEAVMLEASSFSKREEVFLSRGEGVVGWRLFFGPGVGALSKLGSSSHQFS